MNQLLLTPGELLRINEDLVFDSNEMAGGKWALFEALNPGVQTTWPLPQFQVHIPAGTIGKVGNYRIRNCDNPRYSFIPLLVMDSPNKRFMPKSRGGCVGGKRVNIYLPFSIFKIADIERFVPND